MYFRRRAGRLIETLDALALSYSSVLLALSILQTLKPTRAGSAAFAQVFAPYLFVPLAAALPLVLRPRAAALRLALLACGAVFYVRFGRRTTGKVEDKPHAQHLRIMNWNVEWGGQPDKIRPVFLSKPADIVALEESSWGWIVDDEVLARISPHRLIHRRENPEGLVLLSVFPIIEHGSAGEFESPWDVVRLIWARIDIGDGRTIIVVQGHPAPPAIVPPPVFYDPSLRDEQIRQIRALADTFVQNGEDVFVLGLNVTEREVAYYDLTRDLTDAFRAVGTGTGHTWRPGPLVNTGYALLRIDYLLCSPSITPLSVTVDTTPRGSDHALVVGRFMLT